MTIDYILSALIVVLCGVIIHKDYLTKKHSERFENSFKNMIDMFIAKGNDNEEKWQIERQQLLDRIQSPTFAEYKHQEAKIIKAKNGTDKPDIVIEQL